MDAFNFSTHEATRDHLSQRSFIVSIWVLVFIDIIFTIARLWIRIHKLKKLFWDDAVHCLGLVLLISSGALYTVVTPDVYHITKTVKGQETLTVEFLTDIVPRYLKYQYALVILFWSCLWCVKISFLLFYRRFVQDLKNHMIAWWLIFAFVVLSWLGCWVSFMVVAGGPADFFDIAKASSRRTQMRTLVDILYSTAVDVLSDLMIMALPIRLLWYLRISLRKKLGLAAIFSLCAIVIVFAIVRAVETSRSLLPLSKSQFQQTDPIWLSFWSVLESSVAILVSCLPTFRVLFKKDDVRPSASPIDAEYLKNLNSGSTDTSNNLNFLADPRKKRRRTLTKQKREPTPSWGSSRISFPGFRWSSVKGPRVTILPISSNRSSLIPYRWTGSGRISSRGSLHGPLDEVYIPDSNILSEHPESVYERYSVLPVEETRKLMAAGFKVAGGGAASHPGAGRKRSVEVEQVFRHNTMRIVRPEEIGLADGGESFEWQGTQTEGYSAGTSARRSASWSDVGSEGELGDGGPEESYEHVLRTLHL